VTRNHALSRGVFVAAFDVARAVVAADTPIESCRCRVEPEPAA